MSKPKTIREMAFYIEPGDIVNGHFVVEKVLQCVVSCRSEQGEMIKFAFKRAGKKSYSGRYVYTASRDGKVYFTRSKPGGYTHGIPGGNPKYRKKNKGKLRCRVCGEPITASKRTVYCRHACYRIGNREMCKIARKAKEMT